MKKTLILVINFYQIFISSTLKSVFGLQKMCRYSPTCSEYAKTQIGKNGFFRGAGRAVIRILKCQPFINF